MRKYYKVFLLILILFLFIGCVNASSYNDEASNVSTSSSVNTIDIEDNSNSYSTDYTTKPTKEIKTNKLKSAKKEDATGDIITDEISDYDNQNDDMISLNNESLYEDYQDNKEVTLDKNTPNKVSSNNKISVSYSYEGVLSAANSTAKYIDNNHHLPGIVVIDGKNVTINDYLLITCKALNTTSNITINNTYSHCTSVTGTNYPGTTLNKTQYLTLAYNIIKCYDINGKNPYNIRTENKYTMCFDDAVYYYSKILAYKSNNNKLPDSMKMVALYNIDYSSQSDALIVNSSKPFMVTASYKSIGNNKYNFTLTSSETATIYYTRNGTTPTTNSLKYDGTLQIYNNTLIKYFGINKNNIKTPVLEFGIYEDSTPYISSKPTLNKDKVNYNITLSTSQKSKIYYTLNGTRPTTKSTLYTKTINTLTNYTILQYISVTDKNKTSPIYYYHILNPTPYITIINNTEVRDNHQNVSILGNKPGQVYYTRNGTTPTNNSMIYKHKLTDLLITTQLQAILIDKDNKQSLVTTYQPPKIITPAVATVLPQTMIIDNLQTIKFVSNKDNTTVYYTTDGSNPYNSNTTKTVRLNKNMKINKKLTIKYYTRDENQFRSAIYTYTPPVNNEERPTINIYNTTGIYSNGEQRIVIQSNQPGTIYYTTINKEEPIQNIYNEEVTIDKTTKLQAYTINTKYSKILEYNPVNKTKTIMNYTYAIIIPLHADTSLKTIENINLDNKITFNPYLLNGRTVGYSYITGKINKTDNDLNYQSILAGINNDNIIININNYVYGDINQVSMFYYYDNTNNTEYVTILENNKITKKIGIKINKKCMEQYIAIPAFTAFISNFNNETINKTELLAATSGISSQSSEYGWDTVQTYVLTNKLITNDSISNVIKNTNYSGNIKKTAFGTYLAGLSTIYFSDATSSFYAFNYSVVYSRQYDTQLLTGVNLWDTAYMTTNDPTLGTVIYSGNKNNTFAFRFWTTLMLPECEKRAFILCNMTASSSLENIYYVLNNECLKNNLEYCYDNKTETIEIETELMIFTLKYNETKQTIEINTNSTERILFDLNTGIIKIYTRDYMEVLLQLDIEYKGAITLDGQGYCFHDEKTNSLMQCLSDLGKELGKLLTSFKDNAMSKFYNMTHDIKGEILSTVEDIGGASMIQMGATIATLGGPVGWIPGGILIIAGSYMCLDAAGVDILHPLDNPAGLIEGLGSIATAPLFGASSSVVKNLFKLSKPTIKTATKSVLATLNKEKYNILKTESEDYVKGLKEDFYLESSINYIMDCYNRQEERPYY